jgi:hypothetical protein
VAATLYAVPASHPCACVEHALRLKAILYRRVDDYPGHVAPGALPAEWLA